MNDIIKMIKTFQDADLLITGVSKTIEHEAKKQKDGFFGWIFWHVVIYTKCYLIRKLLTAKGVERTRTNEQWITRAGERVITSSRSFNDASSFS